jgi:uncharacterized membrane protein
VADQRAVGWRLVPAVAPAVLLGLATGSRSMLGIATVATMPARASRGSHDPRAPRRWIAKAGPPVLGLAAATELVLDKLPNTPSRLQPPGFVARVVLGAAAAAAAGRRRPQRSERSELTILAGVGAASAVLSTLAGAQWRRYASRRWGRDLPGALVEDASALLCAGMARWSISG